ncbi:aspartate aminotransferase [Enterovibrio norvegicus]|uniref:MalY/PatB family protein n=1 Tax=Enterovibrio norvegicus TaxID=188144 RepID=UPI00030F63A2|nr:PatB family C-S lyase [Enterovibrio norvegicus]OEE68940.1 aspartate aminotransferase [Enterovibrio norvegicus]PMH71946.1 aspartate aminotransferase [Enterovibrio norvegicus]
MTTRQTTFNFDLELDRTHTDSDKWDKYKGQDILPMWVADSDFQSPPEVIEALQERVSHGIFGYTHSSEKLTELFIARLAEKYQWQVEPEWVVYLPGLVCGLNLAARTLTDDGQTIISPSPIYPPFISSAKFAERPLVKAPVVLNEGRWLPDLDAAEAQLTGKGGLFQMCNPLNPGGTVYRREELEATLAFAEKHDLFVCSDEIHCDLLLDDSLTHIPFASLNESAAQRSITLMAPSKTFNIAGLGASIAIIPNAEIRKRFSKVKRGIVPGVNVLAFTAAEAAYEHGEPWLQAQLNYLASHRDLLMTEINAIPGLKLEHIEATYLAWIDCSGLPVDNPHRFFEEAGVGLSPGLDFGNRRFVRLNFGCTRKTLDEALKRMKAAVAEL